MEKRDPAAQPPEPNTERKPYTPPRIEESGQFEDLVLACGRTVTQIRCQGMEKSAG